MTPSDGLPLLWLTGPPGVGKSTVGHALYRRLAAAGTPVAYLDVDQVGMCYPAPPDDPGNDEVKSRSLAAAVAGHRAAGARALVVSGGVEHAETLRRYTDRLPGVALTLVRLRAGDDVLFERIRGRSGDRGWDESFAGATLRSAAALERTGLGDLVLETGGRSLAEVVDRLAGTGWPAELAAPLPAKAPTPATAADGAPVLWVCGAPGVGKSSVGWPLYAPLLGRGTRAGYLDLAQLGFAAPGGPDPLPYVLPGCWSVFVEAGARELVLSGPLPDDASGRALLGLLPGTAPVVVRLHASAPTLAERVRRRGQGRAIELPGDGWRGQDAETLRRIAAGAAREAERLEAAGVGDVRVDTDGLDPGQVAQRVRTAVAAVRG